MEEAKRSFMERHRSMDDVERVCRSRI